MAMFGRFTERAQKAILLAQEEARRLRHNYVGTEHILLGLLAEGEGIAATALNKVGVDLEKARNEVIKAIGQGNYDADIMGFTPRTKRIFELSFLEARNLGHNYVGTEHILLGLLDESEGVAISVLKKLGVDIPKLKQTVLSMLADNQSKGIFLLREELHLLLI